jgi:hypothetical protein
MSLVNLVIALIVIGMALWLINRVIPMQSGTSKCRRRGGRRDLGVAGYRPVGTDCELPNFTLTM